MNANSKGMVTLRGLGHGRCVALAVFNSWGKESYANVKLIPKDSRQLIGEPRILSANKLVLAAASKKFAAILPDTYEEDVTIIFPDQNYSTLKLLLQYIYSGHVVVHHFPEELKSFITDWDICCPEIVPVVSKNTSPRAEVQVPQNDVPQAVQPIPSPMVVRNQHRTYQRPKPRPFALLKPKETLASNLRENNTEQPVQTVIEESPSKILPSSNATEQREIPKQPEDNQQASQVDPLHQEVILVESDDDRLTSDVVQLNPAVNQVQTPQKRRPFKQKTNTASQSNGYIFLATYLKTAKKSLSQKIVATSKALSRKKETSNNAPKLKPIIPKRSASVTQEKAKKVREESPKVGEKPKRVRVRSKKIGEKPKKVVEKPPKAVEKKKKEITPPTEELELVEEDGMDTEEDLEDLKMALAFLEEEETQNKELTSTMKELSSQLQRHRIYVKHFLGDETPSLTFESKALRIPCRICSKLVHRDYMAHHVKIHTDERPYLCDQCGQTFALPERLRVHVRFQHADESQIKPNICPVCGKNFKKADYLQRHMTLHNGEKPYACPYCNKRFRLPNVLSKHKRTHTGEKPYECEICRKRFSARTNFVVHVKTHGKKNRVLESSETSLFVDPETQLLKCDICGTTFHREYAFLVHKAAHKGEEPRLPCRHCPEYFGSLKVLKEHMGSVHPDTFHKCEHCSAMFVSKSALHSHVLIHAGDEPIPCDLCSKEFKTKVQLETHRRNVHPVGRPFPCSFCDKAFKSKLSQRQHERIHTDERPFQCPHCPKAFRQDVHLGNHIRLHTGEKPFVCTYCGKAFSHKNNLSIHTKIHTGDKNQCATCGKIFRSIVKLRLHEETHTIPTIQEDIEEEMVEEMC